MFYSKTRVHRSFTAMFTLVFIVVVSVLAGQALCFAEDEVQQDRVGLTRPCPRRYWGLGDVCNRSHSRTADIGYMKTVSRR